MKNIYGYGYRKPKRDEEYIPPTLSKRDEYIPKTHIGMHSIIRNPKNKTVYMGEKQCQNVREKTFNNVLKIFREYNSPCYADLWNYNIYAINECGLNYFISNPKFAPVGNLIECFERVVLSTHYRGKFNSNRILYVSFGINKKLLVQYFKNVEIAEQTGEPLEIPELPKRKDKSRELVLFGKETFSVDENNSVSIERNALYNRFEHWCILQGVDKREGVLMALETLFKCYPVDGLQENKYYNIVTELDKMVFTQKIESGNKRVNVNLSNFIYGKSKSIIERYNLDPDNLQKGNMDFDTYINNALHLLNSNMPLKYQDPDFVREKENTENMENNI